MTSQPGLSLNTDFCSLLLSLDIVLSLPALVSQTSSLNSHFPLVFFLYYDILITHTRDRHITYLYKQVLNRCQTTINSKQSLIHSHTSTKIKKRCCYCSTLVTGFTPVYVLFKSILRYLLKRW